MTKADYFVPAVVCVATSVLSLLGVGRLLTELVPIEQETRQVIEAPSEDRREESLTLSYLLRT